MKTKEYSYALLFAWVALFAGLVTLTLFVLMLLTDYSFLGNEIHLETFDQAAGFIGGTVGTLWSLASVLFFYSTLRTQQEEIKRQKEEFNISRITDIVFKQLEKIETISNSCRIEINKELYTLFEFSEALLLTRKEVFKKFEDIRSTRNNVSNDSENFSDKAKIIIEYLSHAKEMEVLSDLKIKMIKDNIGNLRGFIGKFKVSSDLINLELNQSDLTPESKTQIKQLFYSNLKDEVYVIREISQTLPYKFEERVVVSEQLSQENRVRQDAHFIILDADRYKNN